MPVPKSVKKSVSKKSTTNEPKIEKEGVLCGCGCGAMTKPNRQFLQGHDARFKARVIKVADGRMAWSDVEKEIESYAISSYKKAIAEIKSQLKSNDGSKPVKAKIAAKVKAKKPATPKPVDESNGDDNSEGQ